MPPRLLCALAAWLLRTHAVLYKLSYVQNNITTNKTCTNLSDILTTLSTLITLRLLITGTSYFVRQVSKHARLNTGLTDHEKLHEISNNNSPDSLRNVTEQQTACVRPFKSFLPRQLSHSDPAPTIKPTGLLIGASQWSPGSSK